MDQVEHDRLRIGLGLDPRAFAIPRPGVVAEQRQPAPGEEPGRMLPHPRQCGAYPRRPSAEDGRFLPAEQAAHLFAARVHLEELAGLGLMGKFQF
jgi:hypothetical protein